VCFHETVGLLNEAAAIPDLLRAAPHVRPVLDRYGLRAPLHLGDGEPRAHGLHGATLLRHRDAQGNEEGGRHGRDHEDDDGAGHARKLPQPPARA